MKLRDLIHPDHILFPSDLTSEKIYDLVKKLQQAGDEDGAAVVAALQTLALYCACDINALLQEGFDSNLDDCEIKGVRDTIDELRLIVDQDEWPTT